MNLNERLAEKQKISQEQRHNLYVIYDKMDRVFIESTGDHTNSKSLIKTIEDLEFGLQKNWNFPQDKLYHTWWDSFPACTCPKLRNQRLFGKKKIYSKNCPIHSLLFEEQEFKVIYAQDKLDIVGPSIFLAGPTPRDPNIEGWRKSFIEQFENSGFKGTLLIPEFKDLKDFTGDFAYDKQIEWEHKAMEKADIILFWIPRSLPDMPAFTTNTEFGYWLAKDPLKIRLGIPRNAVKCDYIKHIANREGIPVHRVPISLILKTIGELNE